MQLPHNLILKSANPAYHSQKAAIKLRKKDPIKHKTICGVSIEIHPGV